ncbi:MAG: type and secretion system protein, partial [Ramlibacter sp.]|nr:type and secretion system protein [Ramlibacter sp.]
MKNTNEWSWRALGAVAAMLMAAWSGAVQAAPAVENITGSMQGGTEVVRIEFSEALSAAPTGFAIQSPARIALDVPGATNNMGRNAVDVNVGNLRSVSVVQASDRARLVLNLKAPTNYRTQLDGKSLIVTLEPVAQAATPTSQPAFAESRNRDTQPLRDLDFRRGPDGSGRVIVDLASNQVGVDIRQQGQTLVVEFLKSTLPEGLRRRMDVTDFGTPIQAVSTSQ